MGTVEARKSWEKDHVKYPIILDGTCAVCGLQGGMKLAFDRLSYICLGWKPCLDRRNQNLSLGARTDLKIHFSTNDEEATPTVKISDMRALTIEVAPGLVFSTETNLRDIELESELAEINSTPKLAKLLSEPTVFDYQPEPAPPTVTAIVQRVLDTTPETVLGNSTVCRSCNKRFPKSTGRGRPAVRCEACRTK